MKSCTTIVMTEENLHNLILIAGETAYDRCKAGQSWEQTRIEVIDALVACTRPLEDGEAEQLGVNS